MLWPLDTIPGIARRSYFGSRSGKCLTILLAGIMSISHTVSKIIDGKPDVVQVAKVTQRGNVYSRPVLVLLVKLAVNRQIDMLAFFIYQSTYSISDQNLLAESSTPVRYTDLYKTLQSDRRFCTEVNPGIRISAMTIRFQLDVQTMSLSQICIIEAQKRVIQVRFRTQMWLNIFSELSCNNIYLSKKKLSYNYFILIFVLLLLLALLLTLLHFALRKPCL